MKARILFVDDEREQISFLARSLEHEGYEVAIEEDEFEALFLFDDFRPDLVILDIGFGDDSWLGLNILKSIREKDQKIPIIMLTGLSDARLPQATYNRDADHFVSKSASTQHLLALVYRCLRRDKPELILICGRFEIDRGNFSVKKKTNGEWQNVHLEPREFKLLEKLVDNAGWVVTREVLEDYFPDAQDPAATLNRYISELRHKLEPDPRNPQYILTKRGIGYKFKDCR